MLKLDSKDYKILFALYQNSRQSHSSIANNVQLNRNIVKYRVKKLFKNGIIKNYFTLIDLFAIGYTVYQFYFRLQFTTSEKNNEIIEYFKHYKNTWKIEITKGKYDIILSILVEDPKNMSKFYDDILKKYRYYFKEILFSQIYEIYGFNQFNTILKKDNNIKSKVAKDVYKNRNKNKLIKLDNIDKKILFLLTQNARISTIEIGKTLSITAPTVCSHIKKLIKLNIIKRFSININTNLLGYKTFLVSLSIQSYDKIEEIIKHLIKNPYVLEINKTIGCYNLEIRLFSTTLEHFHAIIEDLRTYFSNDIVNFDYLYIENEIYYSNH